MPRSRAIALAIVGSAALVAAQGRPADGLVLLVTGPSGQAIAGARGELRVEPAREQPALRGLPIAADGRLVPPGTSRWLAGTSNERGLLRFERADDAPAGAGVVTTASGLGAVVARLLPGRAQRITLQPMAAVTTATGSEPFDLHAVAWLPTGESVPLPMQRGTEARLPVGTYEVWAQSAEGWTWQRLSLASGQRSELRFDGPAQRVHRRAGAAIYAAGRLDVPLFDRGDVATLRGAALAAPLLAFLDEGVVGPDVLPGPPRQEPIEWPPERKATPTLRVAGPRGETDPTATLVTLTRTEGDHWRVLLVSPWRDGFTTLAAPPGDCWLLRLAAGAAPRALPWSDRAGPGLFAPEPGVPLVVHARDEHGLPVVDLAVGYTPEHMEPAAVAARSDARGTARLGPVLGPGRLEVSDPRFANQDVPLLQIPLDGVALTVTAGSELRGRAVWPDGAAARGVVVTLRDPSGRLRPASRALVAAADGAFAFPGLPDDLDLVVFVTTQRQGRTWTARRPRARAGADVELVLRDEDPSLEPPREPR